MTKLLKNIIEDSSLSVDNIYEQYFKNEKSSIYMDDIFKDSSFLAKDIPNLKASTSKYFNINDYKNFSPFIYALSLSNFNFINAFLLYIKNNNFTIDFSNVSLANHNVYYRNIKLAEVLLEVLESSKINEKEKTILANFFQFYKNPYTYNSCYRTAIYWALKNNNQYVLDYLSPLIIKRYSDVFFNIVRKEPITKLNELHHFLQHNKKITKEDLQSFNDPKFTKNILDVKFFFNFCKNITKKDVNIQKENLKYFFNLIDYKYLFKQVYLARKNTTGKTDPYSILDKYKNNPVLMLIKKDSIDVLNIFFDYGYIPDNDEIKLILNSVNFSDISPKHKPLFENNPVDRLEILVKGFEVHLIKRSKNSIKKLRDFMSSLNQEDKEYLYSYYEQFKETNLSSYSFLNVQGINNERISIIDHIVKNGFYEQVNLLLEYDFVFTNEQSRNFLDCFSFNNDNNKFSEFDPSFTFEGFLKNIKQHLSESEIKTMLAHNVTYGYKVSFNHTDDIYNILLKDLNFNSFEINHILSGRNQNLSLLYKFYKNNLNHFFNHNSFYNYAKDYYLYMIFFYSKVRRTNRINIHPEIKESSIALELLAVVTKNVPDFERPFFEKIKECNNFDKDSIHNQLRSQLEKTKITLALPEENTGSEKVKIRRRI